MKLKYGLAATKRNRLFSSTLILVSFVLIVVMLTGTAQAAMLWGAPYPVMFNNNIPNGTRPYDIPFTIHKGTGTNSATDVYCNNYCNFTSAANGSILTINWNMTINNVTTLPFWVESNTSDSSSWTLWTNVTGNGPVQLYAGGLNYSLSNSLGGNNTFLFYDDFDSGVLDTAKWVSGTGTILESPTYYSNYSLHTGGITSRAWGTVGNAYELDYYFYDNGCSARCEAWTGFGNSTANALRFVLAVGYTGNTWEYFDNNHYVDTGIARTPNAWSSIKIIYLGGNQIKYSINNGALVTVSTPWSDGVDDIMFGYGYSGSSDTIDLVRVRPYVSPEPTWATWGDENFYNRSTTLTVCSSGCNFSDINQALPYAYTGDTVDVYNNGSSYGPFATVYPNVSIVGIGMPVVDGKGSSNVISITANDTTMSGFSIINSIAAVNDTGINITSNNNIITNNTVSNIIGSAGYNQSTYNSGNGGNGNFSYGISIYGSSNNITANFIQNNSGGIGGIGSGGWGAGGCGSGSAGIGGTGGNFYGIYLYQSLSNTITNNTIWNNYGGMGGNGMYGGNGGYGAMGGLGGNAYGIYLKSSGSNIVVGNYVSNNSFGNEGLGGSNGYCSGSAGTLGPGIGYGIGLIASFSPNIFYNNYFNNTNGININDTKNNIWNATRMSGTDIIGGHYIGGNYWGYENGTGFSQTCADSDNDGICEFAYALGTNNTDYLPLTVSVSISSSLNASTYGQPVVFTATTSSSAATGTVQFAIDGINFGSQVSISNGSAVSPATSSLSAGTHVINATYSGDSNYTGSTGTLSQIVNKASTTTAVSSTINPSVYGQSVTFTANITSLAGAIPDGESVTFKNGSTAIGTGTTSSGNATFSTSSLGAGNNYITASYVGDANFTASTSSALAQTVNQASTTTTVSSSINPSVYGQSVTFTATVSPSNATGSVQISIDGYNYGSVALSGGSVSYALSTLSAGTHIVNMTYSGDINYTSSTSSLSQIVSKGSTTTTIFNILPSSPAVGQTYAVSFTVTANPPGSGSPTGFATVSDGTNQCSSSIAVGSCSLSSSSAGNKTITVSYPGDSNFNSSSGVASLIVNQASTTTVISSSADPSTYNQSVTFTASVTSSGGGIPDGETVTFKNGSAVIGTGMTASGNATFSTSSLQAGNDPITALYTGDANFSSSTGTLTQTVNQAATTTSVSSSTNPSSINQSITFIAAISPSNATGTVQFAIDGTNFGSPVSISNGSAVSPATSSLSAGTHVINATYSGDSNYTGSTGTLSQTVGANTTTSIYSSLNPSTYGNTVTFTANITSSGGSIPNGETVTFKNGTVVLGTGTTSSGNATFSISSLSVGTSSITAVYVGDANFTASTSSALAQNVNQAASTAAVTSSLNPSTSGQSVTFTATISPSSATGTVQFTIDGTNFGSPVTVSGGSAASPSISSLSVGSHTIDAVYGGDSNYAASTGTLYQTVNRASTTTAISSSLNPSASGQSVTFTATISPSIATGTVQFVVDGSTFGSPVDITNGSAASSSISSLSVGTHVINATYSGDTNYTGSTGTLSQTVKTGTTTAISSSLNPSTYGNAITFTATVTPSNGAIPDGETVTFKEGSTTLGTGTTSSGIATYSTSSLWAGNNSISATYAGDSNYSSSSGSMIQQVYQIPPNTPANYGNFTSAVFDAGMNETFTYVQLQGSGNINQAVVYTSYSMDDNTWSNWAQAGVGENLLYTVASGEYGRYLKYIISAPSGTTITAVTIGYITSPDGVLTIG